MVSRSHRYQLLLWDPNVGCYDRCDEPTLPFLSVGIGTFLAGNGRSTKALMILELDAREVIFPQERERASVRVSSQGCLLSLIQ